MLRLFILVIAAFVHFIFVFRAYITMQDLNRTHVIFQAMLEPECFATTEAQRVDDFDSFP